MIIRLLSEYQDIRKIKKSVSVTRRISVQADMKQIFIHLYSIAYFDINLFLVKSSETAAEIAAVSKNRRITFSGEMIFRFITGILT